MSPEREHNVGPGEVVPSAEAETPVETPAPPMLPLVAPPMAPTLGTELPGPPVEANALPLPDGHIDSGTAVVSPVPRSRRGGPNWGRLLVVVALIGAVAVIAVLVLSG